MVLRLSNVRRRSPCRALRVPLGAGCRSLGQLLAESSEQLLKYNAHQSRNNASQENKVCNT